MVQWLRSNGRDANAERAGSHRGQREIEIAGRGSERRWVGGEKAGGFDASGE
jgi:hypothetical protein